ncbi:hypothetical protein CARUB_v10028565mg, partial [Capsella rubella]
GYECSNTHNLHEESHSYQSSELSSYSPISQPPKPSTPKPNLEEFLAANPLQSFQPLSSSSMQAPPAFNVYEGVKSKGKFEIGENSKRKKGKQIQVEPARNTRHCRKDPRVRFYSVDHEPT